jgi:hypothetical protein
VSPFARTLAQQLFVDLVGRAVFATGSPVKPDADKMARFSIDLAETFERITAGQEKDDPAPVATKFEVQVSDIAKWDKAR